MFGHDAKHTRRSLAPGPETPELHWHFRTDGAIVSSPACGADGAVYVGSSDGFLYALNPDCTIRWQFDAGAPVRSSPEVLPDGTVYVGCDDGRLYAIAPDGTEKWAFATSGSVYSSPVVGFDGAVYFGSEDGSIYAVSPVGTRRWAYQTGGPVLSSAAIANDATVYIGSADGYLYAITHDGALSWRFQTAGPVESSPAIGPDGVIYVGSKDGCLYAVRPDGSGLWRFVTSSSIGVSSPALSADGILYVGAEDGYVYAIDSDPTISNPALRFSWRYAVGTSVLSSPALDGSGRVYVGGQDGFIYALNPTSDVGGYLLWRFPTAQQVASSPALDANGVLFVGSDDGNLYSIGPSAQCFPYCVLDANPMHPNLDGTVTLDGSRSYDPDGGTIIKHEWDWEGDGAWDFDSGQDSIVEHVYSEWRVFNTILRVTDTANCTDTAEVAITVNSPPEALFTADPECGYPPLYVWFDALGYNDPNEPLEGAYDPDGYIVKYEWDFDDHGGWRDYGGTPVASYTFTERDEYFVRLRVTDDDGATGIGAAWIFVDPYS